MTKKQLQALLKQPVSAKLQKIFDRGSDGCFTAKESQTFDMLIAFVRDTSNSELERARAIFHYDSMMECEWDTESRSQGAGIVWMQDGAAVLIKNFLEDISEM